MFNNTETYLKTWETSFMPLTQFCSPLVVTTVNPREQKYVCLSGPFLCISICIIPNLSPSTHTIQTLTGNVIINLTSKK